MGELGEEQVARQPTGRWPLASYDMKKKRMKPVDIVTTCKIYNLHLQAQISYFLTTHLVPTKFTPYDDTDY